MTGVWGTGTVGVWMILSGPVIGRCMRDEPTVSQWQIHCWPAKGGVGYCLRQEGERGWGLGAAITGCRSNRGIRALVPPVGSRH